MSGGNARVDTLTASRGRPDAPPVAGAADNCCHHGHENHRLAPELDPTALVSARGLSLRMGGRQLLDGIDIDIRAGEIVTLIGPNGAGKTTLARVLLGIAEPDAGRMTRRPGLRVGYVPQRFDIDQALPMTVARFLALGRHSDSRLIGHVLAEVGARQVADRPLGQVSGGELRRVIMARALLADPQLLVLDEPVEGVDYAGEAELYTLIGRLRDERGLGILLISHDLHVVMAASDRVVCLNRHVCCSGVPEAVSQHPEYMRLFGPETGRAYAVYHHHHDHRHDLAGATTPGPVDGGKTGASG